MNSGPETSGRVPAGSALPAGTPGCELEEFVHAAAHFVGIAPPPSFEPPTPSGSDAAPSSASRSITTILQELLALATLVTGTAAAVLNIRTREWDDLASLLDLPTTLAAEDTPFCTATVCSAAPVVVRDAREDPRYSGHELVTGPAGVVFYAGVPIWTDNGQVIGAVCVADRTPGELTERQIEALQTIGGQVADELTLRRQAAVIAAEIEQREEAEQLLRRNQNLLTALLDNTKHMVFAKDVADGRFLFGNPTLCHALRMEPEDLVGHTDHDLFPAEDADRYRAADLSTARSGEYSEMELSVANGDGTSVEYLSTRFPLHDEDGHIYAVATVAADISELVAQRGKLEEAEARWRSLVQGSPVGITMVDENGCFAGVNAAMCELIGLSEDEIIGLPTTFFDPDDATCANIIHEVRAAPDGIVRTEWFFVRSDGEVRCSWLTVSPIAGPDGQMWTLGHVVDITERKAAEQALAESEANLIAVAGVVQQVQNGADARQIIVEAAVSLADASFAALMEPTESGAALTVTAATYDLLVGVEVGMDSGSVSVLTYASGEPRFIADAVGHPLVSQELLEMAAGSSMSVLPVCSGEETVGVLLVVWRTRVDTIDDRRAAVVALLADQTGVALRQAALVAELERLAHIDPLTTLLNRRGWDRQVEAQLSAATREKTPLTVALADLDFFKRYNDDYGHQAGDVLLRKFAAAAAAAVRGYDVVARWGGEEFAFALPNCSNADAYAVLERILRSVPDAQTCSIGFATWHPDETAADLIARADLALYRAKTGGRNRLVTAEGELDAIA